MHHSPDCLNRGFSTIGFALTIGLLASLVFAQQRPVVSDTGADAAPKTAADQTEWLQSKADGAEGVLQLPAGTLHISRSIVIDLRKSRPRGVRGAQGTTRIVMNGAGPAVRIVGDHRGTADPASVQTHTWQRERMPIVSDLEIVVHPEADGIELIRTMQTVVDRVSIRQCRYGIHLVERNRNFILKGSHIYDGLDSGVFFDHCNLHQVNILGNHISYNCRAGIRQLEGDVHNIQITGNDIEYNSGTEPISAEILLEAANGFISEYVIANNTIQATPVALGANILIAGKPGKPSTSARTMTITGNVIGSRTKNLQISHATRVTVTGNTVYGGTELNVHLVDCHNVLLGSNNVGSRPSQHAVTDTYRDGVLLQQCENCMLTGNIFSALRSGSESKGGSVSIVGCRDLAVSNCQIIDPLYRGLFLADTVGCRVSNNSILDRRNASTMLRAIEVTGKSSQVVVQNNNVSGDGSNMIKCEPEHGVSQGNTIWPATAAAQK